MRASETIDVDCLVLGQGAAGTFAASLLSSDGYSVALLGEGTTSTSLSTGCISSPACPEESGGVRPDVLSEQYPFCLAGDELEVAIKRTEKHLLDGLAGQGIEYRGSLLEDHSMITNIGTRYRCSIAPSFSLDGDVREICEGGVAILGIMGHVDLDPDLLVEMLPPDIGIDASAYWTQLQGLSNRSTFLSTEVDSLSLRERVVEQIADAVLDLPQDFVGIPPLFGLRNWKGMEELQRSTGRTVFELITPMSLPGLRLQEAMEDMALTSGARPLKGRRAVDIGIQGDEAFEALFESKTRRGKVSFSSLIVATGDVVGGGLVCGERIVDAFNLFLAKQPNGQGLDQISGSGLVSDGNMRLFNSDGRRLRNVFGAGSVLSGVSYPSGAGLAGALFTASMASRSVREG